MTSTGDQLLFHPIGFFRSSKLFKYDAPKQPPRSLSESERDGSLKTEHVDHIELKAGQNFEQALIGIQSCSHLWIIYSFHLNQDWKPMIQPPTTDRKVGVFATRAPYRPNSIGLSCVSLLRIEGLNLFVGEHDILDGTPVLDIKPYNPQSDVITNASIGWLEESLKLQSTYQVSFSPVAQEHLDFLEQNGVIEIRGFIIRQLSHDPINKKRKRISEQNSFWTLSYRTWRADFVVVEDTVSILGIRSGYLANELSSLEDPYGDKSTHKHFIKYFE